MYKKGKWSRKLDFKTNADRFGLVESLLGGSVGVSVFGQVNPPGKIRPHETRIRETGVDISIFLVKHIRSPRDGSIHLFYFEGIERCCGSRQFRGQYDFIRKTGWVQYKDPV